MESDRSQRTVEATPPTAEEMRTAILAIADMLANLVKVEDEHAQRRLQEIYSLMGVPF